LEPNEPKARVDGDDNDDDDENPPNTLVFAVVGLKKGDFDDEESPPPNGVLALLGANVDFDCVFENEKGLLGAALDMGG